MTRFSFRELTSDLTTLIAQTFSLETNAVVESGLQITITNEAGRGDVATNAAMILTRMLKVPPRAIATTLAQAIQEAAQQTSSSLSWVQEVGIAGPGFINLTLKKPVWALAAQAIAHDATLFFKREHAPTPRSYLIEFVSANPTGPLHLGHGRNAIIGDVLQRVLKFMGHSVHSEFYINDAGSQMVKLGQSLRARCRQQCNLDGVLPEDGYQGEYMIDLAAQCIAEYGATVLENNDAFFTGYAHDALLALQQDDLHNYRVHFDTWFSEKTLHDNGSITSALDRLKANGYLYEQDGAWWFASTQFGDDKDRVIRKQDGSLTYIAADIAYHILKFERGYSTLINILGQDHHGYVLRLKGTMAALGYNAEELRVLLYQLVSIKQGNLPVKMSKRAGTFTSLADVIDAVGVDAARFYFLNKKAEAHLELDIEMALKQSNENPVFYLQYAYVRTASILARATEQGITPPPSEAYPDFIFDDAEIMVLKKALELAHTLRTIEHGFGTHLLAFYALDLAQAFHTFYTNNKIIDPHAPQTTARRLALTVAVQQTVGLTHDLLGLTRREVM